MKGIETYPKSISTPSKHFKTCWCKFWKSFKKIVSSVFIAGVMIHHRCSVISSGEIIAVFVYILICLHSHWSALSINVNSEMNCHYSPYCTVMSIIAGSDHIAEKNELVGGLCFLWSAFASSATACISRVRETACLQFCFWLYCNSWRNVRHFHDCFPHSRSIQPAFLMTYTTVS